MTHCLLHPSDFALLVMGRTERSNPPALFLERGSFLVR